MSDDSPLGPFAYEGLDPGVCAIACRRLRRLRLLQLRRSWYSLYYSNKCLIMTLKSRASADMAAILAGVVRRGFTTLSMVPAPQIYLRVDISLSDSK